MVGAAEVDKRAVKESRCEDGSDLGLLKVPRQDLARLTFDGSEQKGGNEWEDSKGAHRDPSWPTLKL